MIAAREGAMRNLLPLAIVIALSNIDCRRRPAVEPENPPAEKEARQQRQQPVTIVPPAPAPSGIPLAGEDVVDQYGYPRRYVDRAALRRLLHDRNYGELNRDIQKLQADFESTPGNE